MPFPKNVIILDDIAVLTKDVENNTLSFVWCLVGYRPSLSVIQKEDICQNLIKQATERDFGIRKTS